MAPSWSMIARRLTRSVARAALGDIDDAGVEIALLAGDPLVDRVGDLVRDAAPVVARWWRSAGRASGCRRTRPRAGTRPASPPPASPPATVPVTSAWALIWRQSAKRGRPRSSLGRLDEGAAVDRAEQPRALEVGADHVGDLAAALLRRRGLRRRTRLTAIGIGSTMPWVMSSSSTARAGRRAASQPAPGRQRRAGAHRQTTAGPAHQPPIASRGRSSGSCRAIAAYFPGGRLSGLQFVNRAHARSRRPRGTPDRAPSRACSSIATFCTRAVRPHLDASSDHASRRCPRRRPADPAATICAPDGRRSR